MISCLAIFFFFLNNRGVNFTSGIMESYIYRTAAYDSLFSFLISVCVAGYISFRFA